MRRLFRWAFRAVLALMILAAAGVLAVILLRDTVTKDILVSRLRSRTGMEVDIKAVHVGLLSPTFSVEGLVLHNPPAFGGSVCLDMPELHLEYDRSALRARQLHLTLLRLDIEQISLAVDKHGRSNFAPFQQNGRETARRAKLADAIKFTGIDVLNLTLGKVLVSHLASGRAERIDFGIKNQITRDVKPGADLASLGLGMFSGSQGASSGGAGLNLSQLFDKLIEAR